jgi:hypothetical protein
MKLTAHIVKQANNKNIPVAVVQKIANKEVSTLSADMTNHDRICTKCGYNKKGYSNIEPIVFGGVTYMVKVVVCVKCDEAITCFPDERLKGYTPIHPYQWAKGQRSYTAKCHECNKKFVIDSQSMAECVRKTTHKCHGETRHIMDTEGN